MNPRTVFIAAVILAYAGVFVIFRKKYLSLFGGVEYLLIGFLFSVLPVDTASLKPLLFPFLGWIGLLIGLQLKFTYLKGLPSDFYLKVVLYTVLFTLSVWVMLLFFNSLESAFAAGIAMSSISYKSAAYFIPAREKKNRFTLFFISFIPFISLVLLFSFYLFTSTAIQLVFILSVTIVSSIILRMTLAIVEDRRSVVLLLIGFIIFISETCAILKISPLVVSFFIGIYITNFSHWKEFILTAVYKDEKPLYTLFLTLLGMVAGISVKTETMVYILFITFSIALLKFIAFNVKPLGLSRYSWFLFLAPGGFSIAIITDYWLKAGPPQQTVWLFSFLVGIIILQFISIFLGKRKKYKDG